MRPPRRSPSAPANDASTGPALGLGCAGASRRQARRASPGRPPTSGAQAAVTSADTRAGTTPATSSARAEAHPKRSWCTDRCPTMASRVLTARWPSSPGTPATAPHTSGATTASAVFSATDSRAARASPSASRDDGSRPHRWGRRSRPAARSPASSEAAMAAPSPASDVPPSTAQVAAAVTTVRATACRATDARRALRLPRPRPRGRRVRDPGAAAVRPPPSLQAGRPDPNTATGWPRRGSPNATSASTPSASPRAREEKKKKKKEPATQHPPMISPSG